MTSTPRPVHGWYPDPAGRHDHRWWDGARWTTRVADGGSSFDEPAGPVPTPAVALPAPGDHVGQSELARLARRSGTLEVPVAADPHVDPSVSAGAPSARPAGAAATLPGGVLRGGAGSRPARRWRGSDDGRPAMDRARYWRLYLLYVAAVALPALLVSTLALVGMDGAVVAALNVVVSVVGVVLLVPLGMATALRLQDAGEPRSRLLLALVPIVGWAWLVVLLLRPGVGDHPPGGAPREEPLSHAA